MKRLASVFLFVLICAHSAAAGPKQLFMTDGDAGSVVTLDQRTVAVIELWSNPSTGHGWSARQPVGKNIRIIGSEFESSQPGRLGAWGKEKIYVVGNSKGRSELVMQYRRPKDAVAMDSVKFNFDAAGKFKETFSMPSAQGADPDPSSASQLQAGTATSLGLPVSFNWCDQGGCTPVKDQGDCGSCWAFATTAPLESMILVNNGVTVDLSEQYLVSCNDDDWGCDGGSWAHDYHQWKMVTGENMAGAVMESLFPYQDADGNCNPPHAKAYQIDNWQYVCGSAACTPTTDQIKQAIYARGPLSVAVCVNTAFQEYTGGVFDGPGCSDINHGVVLVGWDDDNGCWIMRNSWGSSWGESGYMRIKYGVSSIGSIASYIELGESPDPEPDPEPDDNELANGETAANLAASKGEWLYYYLNIPQDAANLAIKISGGSGDADLYTRIGTQPTVSDYDCRPYRSGNNETCAYPAPQAGQWFIGLRAYASFSGVSLTAAYDEGSTDPQSEENEITNGQSLSDLSAAKGEWVYYYIEVPEDSTTLQVRISGGSGDADLYTRHGSQPTKAEFDCRPYLDGNNETCSISVSQGGKYFIGLNAYKAFSGVNLTANHN